MNKESYRVALERKLVRHCTPTLAAIKPANLFTCPVDLDTCEHKRNTTNLATFKQALQTCRGKLAPCGVRIEILARRSTGFLLYVYRPDLLTQTIQQNDIATYLQRLGYNTSSLSECIVFLHHRICGTDLQSQFSKKCSFPHEIGFFLGYPYEDVVGFIENAGENFLCLGCWKVYSKQRDAQECFCRYKNCTAAYIDLFERGVALENLAHANQYTPSEVLRATG